MRYLFLLPAIVILATGPGCQTSRSADKSQAATVSDKAPPALPVDKDHLPAKLPACAPPLATALFAGGCFWCMTPPFARLPGVAAVISGFSGGTKKDPTYEEVSDGGTGHAESVWLCYDPRQITYERLLHVFWRNIDPTTPNRQFCDGGTQYRSAIFYKDEEQHRLAEQSKQEIDKTRTFKEPIVTEIVAASQFYPAEEYHQDYHKKNPVRYQTYRLGCGRDRRLEQLWGPPEPGSGH